MKALLIGLLMPVSAMAQDWVHLTDDAAITGALAGQAVTYDAYTRQAFGADGDTQYITDRFAEGRWAARGGQYCSTWPPADTWACYDFYVAGDMVRFVGSDRIASVGTRQP